MRDAIILQFWTIPTTHICNRKNCRVSGTIYLVSDNFYCTREKRKTERKRSGKLRSNGVSGMQLCRGVCNACVNGKVEYGEINRSLFRAYYVLPFPLPFFVPRRSLHKQCRLKLLWVSHVLGLTQEETIILYESRSISVFIITLRTGFSELEYCRIFYI